MVFCAQINKTQLWSCHERQDCVLMSKGWRERKKIMTLDLCVLKKQLIVFWFQLAREQLKERVSSLSSAYIYLLFIGIIFWFEFKLRYKVLLNSERVMTQGDSSWYVFIIMTQENFIFFIGASAYSFCCSEIITHQLL